MLGGGDAVERAGVPGTELAVDSSISSSGGWYYLVAGSHAGPYTIEALQGLHRTGYLLPDMLVWADGRPAWQALSDVSELASVLVAPAVGIATTELETAYEATAPSSLNAPQSAAPAAQGMAAGGVMTGRATSGRGVAAVAAAIRVGPVADGTPHDPLAEFTAEISAIEQERGESPEPGERSFVDDDGTAYQWDSIQRRFLEMGSQPAVAAYGVEDMTFAVEADVIPPIPERPQDDDDEGDEEGAGNEGKQRPGADKRKLADAFEREKTKAQRIKEVAEKKANWFDLKQNTSVYVTGLPPDATEAEVLQLFSKCGVVKSADDGRPRVKVYREEDGTVKGDGLVTYLKAPSVDLAIQIIDGTPLREGLQQKLSVTQAKFEQKGDFVAKKKAAKKKKVKKVLEKQEERELGWGGFDDVAAPNRTTVVLKAAFHPSDFEEDISLRDDLESDITGECEKMGVVEKVKIFHTNPEGVVTIKFREETAAEECIQLLHKRYFGGRQLSAAMWDGFTSYHVKLMKETPEEQAARLAKYNADLERS